MSIIHRFNNTDDLEEGGMWFGDDGELICKWNWDRKRRKLEVRCGSWRSAIYLSKYRERDMTDEKLKKRLPKMAIEKAEMLNDTKYDRSLTSPASQAFQT